MRELQRRYALAVLVVHHAKKGADNVRAGQALRGTSEFHAWGDSNSRSSKQGRLSLCSSSSAMTTQRRRQPRWMNASAALAAAASPMALAKLRSHCRVRTATLYERLAALTATGRIAKAGDGSYRWVGDRRLPRQPPIEPRRFPASASRMHYNA